MTMTTGGDSSTVSYAQPALLMKKGSAEKPAGRYEDISAGHARQPPLQRRAWSGRAPRERAERLSRRCLALLGAVDRLGGWPTSPRCLGLGLPLKFCFSAFWK